MTNKLSDYIASKNKPETGSDVSCNHLMDKRYEEAFVALLKQTGKDGGAHVDSKVTEKGVDPIPDL